MNFRDHETMSPVIVAPSDLVCLRMSFSPLSEVLSAGTSHLVFASFMLVVICSSHSKIAGYSHLNLLDSEETHTIAARCAYNCDSEVNERVRSR